MEILKKILWNAWIHIKNHWRFYFLLLISIVLFALPIYLYVSHFNEHDISNNPKHWADFGTYFSGIYTPLFTLANLGILIYIAYWVKTYEDKRFITTFRLEALNKLSRITLEITSIENCWEKEEFKKLIELLDEFIHLTISNALLFPHKSLSKTASTISENKKKLIKINKKRKDYSAHVPEYNTLMSQGHNVLISIKLHLLMYLSSIQLVVSKHVASPAEKLFMKKLKDEVDRQMNENLRKADKND